MGEDDSQLSFQTLQVPVKFLSTHYTYNCNEDLFCEYELINYEPQEGDRIAIFKVGWLHVKDYEVFEWAPFSFSGDIPSVTFHRHILPKNTTNMYQICYITAQNELQGASKSFQFVNSSTSNNKISPPTADSGCSSNNCINMKELKRLRKDNFLLKESLKTILNMNQNNHNNPVILSNIQVKNYDKEIKILKEITLDLRNMVISQQQEINSLKLQIGECGNIYNNPDVEKVTIQETYNDLKHSCDKKSPKKINTECSFDYNLLSLPTLQFNKDFN